MTFVTIPKYIPKFGKEREKQIKMLFDAKMGDPRAIKQCENIHLDVWTQEQLDALNYYRNVKDSISNNGRMKHPGRISLTRVSYMGEIHEAEVLWVKGIKRGYYLICSQFDDGVISLWVARFKGQLLQPLCDVTRWSEFNDM